MAFTYEDFIKNVAEENRKFVDELHTLFLENDCNVEIKEAKQGFVASYSYKKDNKKIALMNYVFRKSGMLVRIYARHIAMYEQVLDTLPAELKKSIIKGGDCKRLTGVSQCSPTCTAGYDFMMDGINYKKCKNNAFFWLVSEESKDYSRTIIEKELQLIDVE